MAAKRGRGGKINTHCVTGAIQTAHLTWRLREKRNMEYPKKFSRSFPGEKPVIIIRASGETGAIKIKEYRLTKEIGKMGVYK
ncbi:MAG: hypothetical protein V3U75_06380 [Methylococcaceae bacterium]